MGTEKTKTLDHKIYVDKYVFASVGDSKIYGKLEKVENGYALFSEVWSLVCNEVGERIEKKHANLLVDLLKINLIDETPEPEINSVFSRYPNNREYFNNWIYLPEKEIAGKLIYIAEKIIRLLPCAIRAFTNESACMKIEEKTPITVPNGNLVIIPTSEESIKNYITYYNKQAKISAMEKQSLAERELTKNSAKIS